MALIVLAAICLLACTFLLFVLFQWTGDTKRRATTRAAVDDAAGGSREKTRIQAAARASTEKRYALPEGHAGSRAGARSRVCRPGCHRCERTAYEKVVRSLRLEKRIYERRMRIFKWKRFAPVILVGLCCASAVCASAFAVGDGKDKAPDKRAASAKIDAPGSGPAQTASANADSTGLEAA